MAPKATDIAALVELFATSGWDELHVEIDGVQLFLSTDPNASLRGTTTAATALPLAAPLSPAAAAAPAHAAATAPTRGGETDTGAVPDTWIAIKAPNLGTFYRAPKPGAPSFIEIGQAVTPATEICLLEVMKLFTTVMAGVSGIVRKVCVSDGTMVEFEQILFYIERG